VVNIVGEHAVTHIELDAPLSLTSKDPCAGPLCIGVHLRSPVGRRDCGRGCCPCGLQAANVAPGQVRDADAAQLSDTA